MNAPVQFVMVLPSPITAHEAAAILGRFGGQAMARKLREPIRERAAQIRCELGLKPHPALREG